MLARDTILPVVRAIFAQHSREELLEKLEKAGLAFAPIARPEDLADDPHLNANGGLVDLTLDDGRRIRLPALPIQLDGAAPGVRHDLPQPGGDSRAVLGDFGFREEIDAVMRDRAIAVAAAT